MNTQNTLMFLCGYSSAYGGNFIPSLLALEKAVSYYNCSCIYVFPKEAESHSWVRILRAQGKKILTLDFHQNKFSFVKALRNMVRTHKVTILHTHFAPILTTEILSLIVPKLKVFIHIHSDFSAGKISLKEQLKNWLMFKFMSGTVCSFFSVTPSFEKYNPRKIHWVPNALALNRIQTDIAGGKAIRKKFHIPSDEIFCELFGWSPYVKGVDVAVNAIKQLNEEKGKSVTLGIVCGGDRDISKIQQWVKENTDCSGDEAYLRYLPPREDVFSYHEAADFLVSASRSEGFPYSILEMLSLGKPCIISDIPGVQWAKEFSCVSTFPSADSRALTESIRQLLLSDLDPDESISLQVKASYNIETWVRTICTAFFPNAF